jgi:hypothetical protein
MVLLYNFGDLALSTHSLKHQCEAGRLSNIVKLYYLSASSMNPEDVLYHLDQVVIPGFLGSIKESGISIRTRDSI